ncbi:MAG: acyl-[acyl-carrier-protein] thioesterase [Chloroflexi bacterium]|nr:acyl-[acyl-carrier-protein] thioesterase [Chloroflexota bacterium]
MNPLFTTTFRVRGYEVDERGNVHHAVLVNWFQETAFQASTALGYGVAEYAALGTAWVVRELDVEFLADARYGDEVVIESWVSDVRRVRSHRDCVARRARDGALLAHLRIDWVYVDRTTGMLRRVPAEISERVQPFREPAMPAFAAPENWRAGAPRFETMHRVQAFEIDEMHIVNHPNYINWLEEQTREAFAAQGGAAAALQFARHFLEFKQPARVGEVVTLASASSDDARLWHHQIKRGDTLLVEAFTET